MTSISDRVVVITGAGRGIGAATAKALAAKGAKLVLTDLDEDALTSIAAEIGPDRALVTVADVRDLSAMEAVAQQAVSRFGRIDVAIANAGITNYGSVLETDPVAFKRVLDVNVLGVFHTARATLPALFESKGYLLVVSSMAAFAAAPGMAAYAASKAGVEQFANAVRLEVAHHGVAVGSAHMSWIDTPLVRDAKEDLSAFRELLSKLPFPLNRTTSVDACADAFVKGIEKRSRHVYCPSWVAGLRAQRNLLNSGPIGRLTMTRVPDLVSQMDSEVRALGRATSARNVANDAAGAAVVNPES